MVAMFISHGRHENTNLKRNSQANLSKSFSNYKDFSEILWNRRSWYKLKTSKKEFNLVIQKIFL